MVTPGGVQKPVPTDVIHGYHCLFGSAQYKHFTRDAPSASMPAELLNMYNKV
eukprot:CAMPEP_0202896904 /NCGR_PEP_ID=MMETSP1392-20130828/5806_1 /ASSEMBLY_ACC=CAM_ASM_000868 /TAXON_ID=225041 /ORGANISM="Chlamydomonas chlamydogama, Strain SAG 11-48b" /LENGTH=51 /DNA_ID=CAMNT_0049582409 /DNA_START=119 /DNA_END=274 /DNA_ORIENTATION=+